MAKSCYYCRPDRVAWGRLTEMKVPNKRDIIRLGIQNKSIVMEYKPHSYDELMRREEFEVNFCPVCGRKLRRELI